MKTSSKASSEKETEDPETEDLETEETEETEACGNLSETRQDTDNKGTSFAAEY